MKNLQAFAQAAKRLYPNASPEEMYAATQEFIGAAKGLSAEDRADATYLLGTMRISAELQKTKETLDAKSADLDKKYAALEKMQDQLNETKKEIAKLQAGSREAVAQTNKEGRVESATIAGSSRESVAQTNRQSRGEVQDKKDRNALDVQDKKNKGGLDVAKERGRSQVQGQGITAGQRIPAPQQYKNDPDGTTYNGGRLVKQGKYLVPGGAPAS